MIRKSVLLPCSSDAAFDLFSRRINEWWPRERRHVPHPEGVITLRKDRFYEQDPSGRAVELGVVRAWEPPVRILLDWYPGTDENHPTEVEILFLPEGSMTRVEVHHRPGPKSRELFPTQAPRYDASWDIVLAGLAGLDDW